MKGVNLDRRVQFLRSVMVDDGFQTRPGPYVPFGPPTWAHKNQISDGERFRANSTFQDMTARFQVRYSEAAASITSSDRLLCEGVLYGVGGVKEIGRRDGIEITARRIDE